MNDRPGYHEAALSDFLTDVEELIDRYEQLKNTHRQLKEEKQKLERELELTQNKKDKLENELQSQEQATVEFAGRLEKRFKEINKIASGLRK